MFAIRETLNGWQVLKDGRAVDETGAFFWGRLFASEDAARDVLARLRAGGWRRHYFRKARAAGIGAARAWSYAKTRERFDDAENDGKVRLVVVADDFPQGIDDFCSPIGPGDNARAVAAQRKEVERMLEREGVSGILAQVATCVEPCRDAPATSSEWETVDSLFGILGDPFDDKDGCEYDYGDDLRRAALRALDEREADARALAGDLATVREYVAGNGDVAAAFERIAEKVKE